jgi:predicted metal-dependent hydrolase
VENYRQQPLADYCHDYLEDRYSRYQQALKIIHGSIDDPIRQGLVLWNLGLFFEVHEVLEHAWYSAEGNMKLTLQALIRSAGVYIKREYGFNDSAERIANKAIPILEANRDILEAYFKVEKLTSALKKPESLPPILS